MLKKVLQNPFFWPVVIFLAAGIFRLPFRDLIEFKADEANTAFQIVEFYTKPYLPQRGLISGIGTYNFPLFTDLMIILGAISHDPQVLSFLIALINTILVVVFYLVTKKFFRHHTAVFASLILAFSPWAIIFSRKIWAQNLILLLLIPLLYFLNQLILQKNRQAIFPISILSVLLIQLHGSGTYLALATSLILLILRSKINLKLVLLGTVFALIPAIPFFVFQLTSSPVCPDCQALSKYQESPRFFDVYNFFRPFQILSGQGFHFVLGNDYPDFLNTFPQVKILNKFFWLEGLTILGGVFFILTKNRKYLFLTGFLAFIPLLYFLTKTQAYMHYFVILIPTTTLISALFFSWLWEWAKKPFIKTLLLTVFGFYLTINISYQFLFNQYLLVKQNIAGDFGPIFAVTKKFVEAKTSQYANLPFYQNLKSYAYIYPEPETIHQKLGGYLLEKGQISLGVEELKQALRINPKDTASQTLLRQYLR